MGAHWTDRKLLLVLLGNKFQSYLKGACGCGTDCTQSSVSTSGLNKDYVAVYWGRDYTEGPLRGICDDNKCVTILLRNSLK